MKRRKWETVLVVFLFAVAVNAAGMAAEGDKTAVSKERLEGTVSPEPEPHHHLQGAWLDWFHEPAPWLKMGLDHRFRTITARNIDTLDSDPPGSRGNKWNFQRYRTRWSTQSLLNEDIDFNTRMVWEFRTWDEPPRKPQHTDFDEILFDRFNFTMRNMFGMPLTGVIGRQDIYDINPWLILDATPLDGSRTIFFDALRLTYDWQEKDTNFDFVYVYHKAASDAWLKPINDRDRHLTEQDEHGVILYLKNKSIKDTQLEGYFIYKNDNPIDVASKPLDFPPTWSRKAEVFTYGAAVASDIDQNWSYRLEGALQRGDKADSTGKEQDLRAYGTKNTLTYKFNDELSNSLHTGYEYLSGDDPGSKRIEQFDPLWGEWPQWSELYIYTYSREAAIAETTNLHRFFIGHTFKPTKKWTVNTDYHLLWADDNTLGGQTFGSDGFTFSRHGKSRGQLLTCWLKWKCCAQLSAHLLGEYLIPGSYYDQGNRDGAFFLRFNVEYRF
jgi:hypothetical protein